MWRFRNNQGFGLLEIVIASAILSVGILGLLSAFPRGIAIEKNMEQTTVAQHLAQERIESFSALHYEELIPGTIESNVRVEPDPESPYYGFFRTSVIALVDENGGASVTDIGLKKITTTIAWSSPFGGASRSVSLATLVSER